MLQGVDFSVGAPTPAQLLAADKHFVCRYLVTAASRATGDTRGITPAEYARDKAAGIEVVPIYEGRASRMLDGYAAGVTDAKYAMQASRELGFPAKHVIYFTADFDVTVQAHYDACYAYLDGAASVIGRTCVGIYGEYDILKACHANGKASFFWQTYAWSRGLLFTSAHLYQYDNYGNTIGGVDVDYDEALRDNYGQVSLWEKAPPPVIKPTPAYPAAILPDWWADALKSEAPHNARFSVDVTGDGKPDALMYEVARRNVTLVTNTFPYVLPNINSGHAGAQMKTGARLRVERVLYGVPSVDPKTGKTSKRDWAAMREGFYLPMNPSGKFRPRIKLY